MDQPPAWRRCQGKLCNYWTAVGQFLTVAPFVSHEFLVMTYFIRGANITPSSRPANKNTRTSQQVLIYRTYLHPAPPCVFTNLQLCGSLPWDKWTEPLFSARLSTACFARVKMDQTPVFVFFCFFFFLESDCSLNSLSCQLSTAFGALDCLL